MDQYNVIHPTSNLNELEKDMADWCRLPLKFRLLSDDDCIRQYGCTNGELYARLKDRILQVRDIVDAPEDNLIIQKESIDFTKYDDYDKKLEASKNLQNSPNIVIIDPNIATIDELEDRYLAYRRLTDKFRLFSNDYSINIWGYNVDNMYIEVKGRLTSEEEKGTEDNDNIVINKENARIEKVIKPLVSYYTEVFASGDYDYIKENSKMSIPNKYRYMYKDILEMANSYNQISVPLVTPWFTESFLPEGVNHVNYRRKLKECITEADILGMGWNPSVLMNNRSIDFAKNRQIEYFKRNPLNIKYKDSIPENPADSMYIILRNPLPDSDDYINLSKVNPTTLYDKCGLCKDRDLKNVYSFSGINTDTLDLKVEPELKDYDYCQIYKLYLPIGVKDKIFTRLSDNTDSNINSVYKYLYKGCDRYDKVNSNLVLYHILHMISKLSNIDVMKNNIIHIQKKNI